MSIMATKNPIKRLTIKGFKSLQNLEGFALDQLNVLIGANGAGKNNFVSYFRMLGELVEQRLQVWTKKQGGADRILTYGVKETEKLESYVEFGLNGYKFTLEPTVDGGFTFSEEALFFEGPYYGPTWKSLSSGHIESLLKEEFNNSGPGSVADYVYSSISSWKVFHFHDTSDTAGVKRLCSLHDNEYLRHDASNLAAYLYYLKEKHPDIYTGVCQ
jgi:predicted ATPase